MRKTSTLSILCIGLALGALQGCHLWPMMSDEDGRRPVAMGKNDQVLYPYNAQPVHLSEDFGQSFSAQRENQILNPQASKNLETPTEWDGMAGEKAIERYQKLYKQPPYGGKSSGGKK